MKKALDASALKEKKLKEEESIRKEQENLSLNQEMSTDDRRLNLVSEIIDDMEKDQNGINLADYS